MKYIKMFAVVILSLSFLSCGTTQRNYRITLIDRGNNSFWESVYNGALEAASVNNVNLTLLSPQNYDYEEQISLLRSSISDKPDAIILAALNSEQLVKPVEEAALAKIPLIVIDSAINSDKWISFIASDNKKIGETIADEIVNRSSKPGKVGVISYSKSSSAAVERVEGLNEAFGRTSGFLPLDAFYSGTDIESSEAITEQMVKDNPDIVAIACFSGYVTVGAGRALENLDRTDILLAGVDCNYEGVDMMALGILDFTVLQNTFQMGYYAVENAVRHLSGRNVDQNINTGFYIVDKDNMLDDEIQRILFPFS